MRLNQCLLELFENQARQTLVDQVCLGLGYTAAATSDGGLGLSYTFFENKSGCMPRADYENPEGRPAIGLLEKITSENHIERSLALALINALNSSRLKAGLKESEEAAPGNQELLDLLEIGPGTKVAMVGAFKPVISLIKQRQAELAVMDSGKQIGDPEQFMEKLANWAEVLILTSTTLLNNTTEDILARFSHPGRAVLLGPSTPLVKEAFTDLPVNFLAGTIPLERENVFRVVRHGAGTPVIQKFGRKVLLKLDPAR